MKKILDMLPPGFRKRSLGVVLTLFLRAVLNFVGVAVLFPPLMLLLDPGTPDSGRMPALFPTPTEIGTERGLVIAACCGAVLYSLLKGVANLRLAGIENRYVDDLYRTFARRLYLDFHRRGMAFIDREDPLLVARKVNTLTRTFASGVLRPAATILAEGLLAGMILTTLLFISPQAAGIAAALLLAAGWLYAEGIRKRIARSAEAETRARSQADRLVVETFRGYADLELSGAFGEMLREFDRAQERLVRAREQEARLRLLPTTVVENAVTIGLVLLAVTGFGAEDSPLQFGIFAMAALRLMPSARSILNAWASIRRNRHAVEELHEVLCAERPERDSCASRLEKGGPETTNDGDCEATLPFEREIRIQGLSFHYPGSEHEVLRDLDLTIPKGGRIGFRGESGIGKSTLLRLVAGLYAPSAGEIRIDGVRLTEKNRQAWQRRIGYVPQRPFFRFGTLARNIAPGTPPEEIDPARMAEALRSARLEAFVASLPEGLDTPVGACTERLSGGQLQRLAIARALYRKADVLLFDEATSSLDEATERDFLQALEGLGKENPGLTILVVAHRREALAGCRRIIELRD